ncbi:MAG: hypothetical protein LBF97_00160, partial [Elusimicrobiota bacterium]|nr:hypothetical protein [Elusimicrobiota bacterium]
NKKIETFADLSYSNGNLYESNGFVKKEIIKPDYMYIKNKVRKHKFNFRIEDFKKLGMLFEEGKSEKELAELNGLKRIYGCSKIKYVLE